MSTVNKRTLAAAAGIALATLDTRIASDPDFPVVRRGSGKGDEWLFELDEALARLHELAPPTAHSPNQQFMALRVLELQRKLALEAGSLLLREPTRAALVRSKIALRRGMLAIPSVLAEEMDLTQDQQNLMRAGIERLLREYVERLRADGLPVEEEEG